MINELIGFVDPETYSPVVRKLREFFHSKNFLEVHTQSRLSILAACEDPSTIATYNYAGSTYPLSQTGQMWLEYELLKYPDKAPGYFCVSTSYRNEPNPIPGRHDKIFPMFEFEMKGSMEDLIELEKELLEHLGFGDKSSYHECEYEDAMKKYNVDELEHKHEDMLCKEYGPVVFLKSFPNHTSPFWNMKQDEEKKKAKKVDIILWGIETVGSAQRSENPIEMRNQFYSISDGNYANILFSNFTKQRVQSELEDFLSFRFFERSGGGIGLTRLIRAMKMSNLLKT